jgi:hypothetical protein
MIANLKQLFGRGEIKVMVVATAIVLASVALMVTIIDITESNPSYCDTSIAGVTTSPEKAFEVGCIRHLVQITTDQSVIEVKRGMSVTIPITISHQANRPFQPITLSNFHDPLIHYPPKCRMDYCIIPVNDFISVSPSSITVSPNSSEEVMLTVSIPRNIDERLLDKTLGISITVETDRPAAKQGVWLDVRVVP